MAVAAVELIRPEPDWEGALARALERPAGVKQERRQERADEPRDGDAPRRRIADELAWLRDVVDDPATHGFRVADAAAQLWWPIGDTDSEETLERLERLRDRGILDAAGFLLHEDT